MEIKNISTQLPWKASLGIRPPVKIDTCVVHHTAVKAGVGSYDFIKRATSYAQTHIGKGWGHIAYHYMIDLNGKTYQCFSDAEIGAHAGDWDVNKRALALCLDGDFSVERPTAAQVYSLWSLLNYLTRERPDMPKLVKETVKTHREVRPTPTSCPSDVISALVSAYRT